MDIKKYVNYLSIILRRVDLEDDKKWCNHVQTDINKYKIKNWKEK
jgi:hypothetical protein